MEVRYEHSLFLCITRKLFFFFYFILFVSPFVVSSHRPHRHLGNASDQEALMSFMSAITYDPSQSLAASWRPNVSFCEWPRVICSRRRQRVVYLNVSGMGLQGIISPLLGNLSFLKILDLSENKFHGPIPYQLGNLFRLKTLYLDTNQFQHSIPPTLGGCRSLTHLSLFANNLQGSIPEDLYVLPNLELINISENNLTGNIPTCLGNISSLSKIVLESNNLHGSVPSELGMLSHLIMIDLQGNHFSGQIPSSLSNCTNLQILAMGLNHLTGNIPMELCSKKTSLVDLSMPDNQLSGNVPAFLVNCTNLRVISLGGNQLNGVVPLEFGKMTQLEELALAPNQLVSGSTLSLPILDVLTNCSNLRLLELSSNNLKGCLPSSIGHLSTKMYSLGLAMNGLVGEIPPQIGNLTRLSSLSLYNNFFTGPMPSSLKMLQNLETLYMGGNNLQGNIPIEIGQLKGLGLLAVDRNNLSGRIPDSIAHLPQLRYLYLDHNQFSGNIPANLGKCINLLHLDLSYNMLSGPIPLEVASLANLAFYFNLSNNLLHGPIPPELSKMTMVEAIDISANRLTGYIPSGLGSCKVLQYLNLSCNMLEGPIPMSLDELQSLEDMDLSFNNLSGGIPVSLTNLKMLNKLNLSFNNLSGEVPKGRVFKMLGATAFMGNPGLCGPWVSLSPCFIHKHISDSHLRIVIIPIVAVAIIVVSCLFLGFLWRQFCKRHTPRTSLNLGYRRISREELIIATKEFSDSNLLGVGNFGKVYKGVLNDGTIIAVKVLNLENEGAHKSFDRECKVLGRVRHRNLIRIITSYSDSQIKALIFPLIPNGSLEKWLYTHDEAESSLSLIQRLNIAIDIAQGMAYLHHHCFIQVIHCDLKPNNVLLGEDMTAYLIDFGIATICFADSGNLSLTSTNALKGSAGYIPPEYGLGGCATTKGDVYSYGVLLLEMLTRKKPTHNMFVEGMNLQKWVGSAFPNQVELVVDKSLLRRTSPVTKEDKELHCLCHLVNVGLFCTRESPEERPTMINIVATLQNIRDTIFGVAVIPKLQSNITHLLEGTSTICNNIDEDQSSSTF